MKKIPNPYASIPSASSFGVGFGYLNTFSQGICSSREKWKVVLLFEISNMILLLVERLNWCHNHFYLALEESFPNSVFPKNLPKFAGNFGVSLQNRTQNPCFFLVRVDGQRFADMLYRFWRVYIKYDLYLNPLRGR